jgi:arginine utilization protein RocB
VTAPLAARARELALLMTRIPSVTGSAADAAFPAWLAPLLSFDRVWVAPVCDDAAARSNLFALRRGRSNATVVLTGHFDVVSVEDYGPLQHLAFEPEALLTASIARLQQSGENPLALKDFESGDYLAGRGLLDMKAGLAAGLAAMEAYRGEATLVFVAVTDEEEKSAGARAAVSQLKALAADAQLDVRLVINLDAISDQGDGSKGRVVTYGSIGKQLLSAFVVGAQTHAGYPQHGVNAAYVMSELVSEIELSTEFSERTGDETAAPPATLYAKELKQGYNVTTPQLAYAYWNTMQHRRSGADVLDLAMQHAARALRRVEMKTNRSIVLRRAATVLSTDGIELDHTLSLPDQTLQAYRHMARAIDTPTVIMGFASIPYAAVLLRDVLLRAQISAAVKAFGLGEVNYFAGISDMSFFGEASGDLSVVAANTPIWGKGFAMPESAGYPTINIGPWGRDYHTWLERVHAPYAFETLPHVLLAVIEAVTKAG